MEVITEVGSHHWREAQVRTVVSTCTTIRTSVIKKTKKLLSWASYEWDKRVNPRVMSSL